MINNSSRYYYSDEINYLLDEVYFYYTRDSYYPTKEIKCAAECAMLRLWNMECIEFGDKVYENQDIRKIMVEEMLPDDLDCAVSFISKYRLQVSSKVFAIFIFLLIINRDMIIEAEFQRNNQKQRRCRRYRKPCSCVSKTEVVA